MSFDIGKMIQCDHVDRYGNSYNTPALVDRCPKCAGSLEYYDFEWQITDGNIAQVVDINLLVELVVKAVLTEIKDNIFHPNYGTVIYTSVAAPASSVEAVARLVEQQVSKAVGGVRFRQDELLQLGVEISDDELIYALQGLDVRILDARTLKITMAVIAESGKSVEIAI